jgi:resuscitation-promoting factor RpfA
MASKHRPRPVLRAVVTLLLVTPVALGAQLVAGPTAAADPTARAWLRLRICESSNRYHINTGSGYYGAYQFDLPTWRSVGGRGRPDLASPGEQDHRALYLYRMRGWQPWGCSRLLGLRNDADARSRRIPTYAESAYISGGLSHSHAPPWPGVVYTFGDCASALRTFQLRMNAFGYGFAGTGCYYEKTRQAVLDLQRANGLNPSGRLGPRTWVAAWEGRPPR